MNCIVDRNVFFIDRYLIEYHGFYLKGIRGERVKISLRGKEIIKEYMTHVVEDKHRFASRLIAAYEYRVKVEDGVK